MGIHSAFLSWIGSYLPNKHCVVAVDNGTSRALIASAGVPLGSILEPFFFILFIDDIGSFFSFAEHFSYADGLCRYSRSLTVPVLPKSYNLARARNPLKKSNTWALFLSQS